MILVDMLMVSTRRKERLLRKIIMITMLTKRGGVARAKHLRKSKLFKNFGGIVIGFQESYLLSHLKFRYIIM